ncbi:MAG: hypothetical protein KOO60_09340 [Gemmatimonadales bacterium]|nr:hypothetical protein [Gemmatimonadales bacterium]
MMTLEIDYEIESTDLLVITPERTRMMKVFALLVFLSVLLTALPASSTPPLGVRCGLTDWNRIDQIHLGMDARMGEIFPSVEFTPNVELGLGDNATILTINGDVAYQFTELVTSPWGMYGGGALSIHFMDVYDRADTDLGLNALFGFTKIFTNGHRGMAEIRLGVIDSPDFKLTFGYSLN